VLTIHKLLASAFVCCAVAAFVVSAFAQAPSGSAQMVEDARGDYYNLAQQGLKEFRCDVRTDWGVALAAATSDAAGREKLLAALGQTHFEAALGTRGGPRVAHRFDGAAPSDEVQQSVRAAAGAAQRSLSGAADEFSSLLFGSPFPPDREYHVEDQGEHLRITFGSDEVRVVETMKKDHAIEEMIIATQHSTVTVRPAYQKTDKGFVPVAIDSKVEAAGADPVELRVEIAYQGVEGFELPQVVTVRDKELAAGAAVRFAFSGCQVTR
jgi:hypothetical protein